MLIENDFTVATPVDELWAYLLDVERIAPCMPGAELTETVGERSWKGKVNVRFGPVALSFAGTVDMTERDDVAHRAVLHAKGREQKGKGAANATVTSWLEAAGPGETTVKMAADISLTGAAAQLSRGLMPEISKKLTQQFADCLEEGLQGHGVEPAGTAGSQPDRQEERSRTPATTSAAAPSSKPVGGLGLGLSAIWRLLKDLLRRLFGGGGSPRT
jgi:uncharacterized protein